ncbi:hypothetical protein H7100_01885 [Candidatus Saccharibacteria bacterium]|nr:hypothetical protein [Candidatus Saccharibacteria bacterium]
MDQQSHPHSGTPVQATSPEEDATLLAIEALEARSVDPNPRPLNAPREVPVPERRPAPALPLVHVAPKVIEPVLAKPVIEPPKKVIIQPQTMTAVAPTPVRPKLDEVPIQVAPAKPKKKGTPSEEMAEALAAAPSTSGFQFFANQKPPRKPFIVIGVVLVIIAVGVGAYFALI